MIAQLVRTKFESNLLSFIVFIALIAAAGARYLMTREPPQGPVTREMFSAAAATLMLCCFVPGIISLLRQNRERSSRLYAQLPVSPRQVRVAYWLHASLYLVIAGVLLQVFLLVAGTGPAVDFGGRVDYRLVSLLLFANLYIWLAGFSLVTSNLSRMVSDKIRRNTVLYCFLVIVATFLIFYGLVLAALVLSGQLQNALQDGVQMTPVLVTLSLLCIAMVALDIYLFGKKDHNRD